MSDFNHTLATLEQIHTAVSALVRKAAFDVQAAAQASALVDTGNLRASIYVVTHNENTYPGDAGQHLLPSIDGAEDDQTAYIAVAADYGVYLELGTSTHPAHPYLAPAAETVRPSFLDAMSRVESLLREVG